MPAPSSFSDLIYQHPLVVSSSVVGIITLARKVTLKGLWSLVEIHRAVCKSLLRMERNWQEYQEARPRKKEERGA
jgi:hypothetical protein